MKEIPQTIKFTTGDIVSFHSELTEVKKEIIASNREASDKLSFNEEWNTAKITVGIRDAADELSKSQTKAADKIAKSIESNTNRTLAKMDHNTDRTLDRMDYNTDRIIGALDDLGGVFDWKLSELIWIQEKQSDYLQEILETLKKPRLTRANELREDGTIKYNNGWIDEAIQDFNLALEENNTDFIVHQSLGNIYLFQKREPEKALNYYLNASKYAIKFPYYNSYALLHAGLSNYFLGRYQAAYDTTKKAIEISPKLIEGYYQHARYCSKIGKYDEALSNLRVAVKADRTYCAKILLEDDFEPLIGKINGLFKDLKVETQENAEKEIDKAKNLISKYRSIDTLEEPQKRLDEAKKLITKGSYIDCKDALYKAYTAEKIAIDSLTQLLSKRVANLKSDYKDSEQKSERVSERSPVPNEHRVFAWIGAPLGLIFGVIFLFGVWIPMFQSALSGVNGGFSILAVIFLIILGGAILLMFIPVMQFLGMISSDNKRKSFKNNMASISKDIALNEDEISRVKSEEQKLNLNTLFMGLKDANYEDFLIKKYG